MFFVKFFDLLFNFTHTTSFSLHLFIMISFEKDISFQRIIPILDTKRENNRRCDICSTNVPRASYAKHLRGKKDLVKIRQDDVIIPECFFKEEQTPIKKKFEKLYDPKVLTQITGGSIKIKDREIKIELAKND